MYTEQWGFLHKLEPCSVLYWYTMYEKSFFSVVVVVCNNMYSKLDTHSHIHKQINKNLIQCGEWVCVCVCDAQSFVLMNIIPYSYYNQYVDVYIDFVQSHMILRNSNILLEWSRRKRCEVTPLFSNSKSPCNVKFVQ